MADISDTCENPKKELYDQLADVNAGMLGLEGSSLHMQPMSHQIDKETGRLVFFTAKGTDIVDAVMSGQTGRFTFISKDQDFHCSIRGSIETSQDPALIDKLWNPVIDAWFEGKKDPALTLLVLTPGSARIWASTNSAIRFGWEILKSNITDAKPDIGVQVDVEFDAVIPYSVAAE